MVTVKKRKLSQAVILSCLQVQAVEELWEEKVKILGDDEEAEE